MANDTRLNEPARGERPRRRWDRRQNLGGRRMVRDRRRETVDVQFERRSGADRRSGAQRRGQAERRISRSEEHTSELQSQSNLVCRLLLEKKKKRTYRILSLQPCCDTWTA